MTEYGDVQELKQHFQTHEVRCSVLVHGSCELDTALKIKCREEEKEERGTKGKGKNTNALWHSPSIASYASQVGLVAQVGSRRVFKSIEHHASPSMPVAPFGYHPMFAPPSLCFILPVLDDHFYFGHL